MQLGNLPFDSYLKSEALVEDRCSCKVLTNSSILLRDLWLLRTFNAWHLSNRPGDIDLRRATHRSSKGDTSIFESRRIDLRRSKAETSHLQFIVEYCPQLRS